ncbi:tRNA1(Val) (adenine(37)-N6)-methyltransferase [Pseudooceanicola sp. MF1-13]|uniref:tRNA1(Val) (adenine(37)-N6)-methyltransferase n=1 Tax=Pseudooceanicola sp. MF1-13 TaxID=3379095 RepID=UPI0038915706
MNDAAEITRNTMLGGRVILHQPRRGYRAGVDPVFLAASVSATAGQSVLDLGCGVGAAALCLGVRVPGLRLVGLERQGEYAALARQNAQENQQSFDVIDGDLTMMPPTLRQETFDHVIANPPYFRRDQTTPAADAGRETAMGEDTPLEAWVDAAARRCKPQGTVSFIHRTERLPDLFGPFSARLGSLILTPLIPRVGRDSQLFILQGRKGGRAAFRLRPGLVVHSGTAHETDGVDYTPEATALLSQASSFAELGL